MDNQKKTEKALNMEPFSLGLPRASLQALRTISEPSARFPCFCLRTAWPREAGEGGRTPGGALGLTQLHSGQALQSWAGPFTSGTPCPSLPRRGLHPLMMGNFLWAQGGQGSARPVSEIWARGVFQQHRCLCLGWELRLPQGCSPHQRRGPGGLWAAAPLCPFPTPTPWNFPHVDRVRSIR